MRFGEHLKSLRIKAGMTMSEVASELGMSVAYWSDVENFRRNPFQGEKLKGVAELFGEEIDHLQRLADSGRTKVSIDLPHLSPRKADMIVHFARVIDALSEEEVDKIDQLLTRRGQ